ncbi:MAG: hypothetical protein RIE06_15260 [Roseibium album]|uniref:hypothetical protein n=1 Tax=Roseibium album TaxID=311410 RepID=UPI0032EE53D2
MTAGREIRAVTPHFPTKPRLQAEHQSAESQNGPPKRALARIRSQSPHEDDRANSSKNFVESFFKKIGLRSSSPHKTSNNPKFQNKTTPVPRSDLTQSTQRLLENKGVELAAVAGEKATLEGETIDVAVEVHDGALADLPKSGYEGNDYSGENVVAQGRQKTLVSPSHLGTHSMRPCCPMIMILKDKKTGALSVSLTHYGILHAENVIAKIETYESRGFEIAKIITGIHGDAKGNYLRQHLGTKRAAEVAAERNIDFGLIKYNDAGKDSWWISVDVSDNSNIRIDIGNGEGLR